MTGRGDGAGLPGAAGGEDARDADGGRLRLVVRTGQATPEEVAALVVALTATAADGAGPARRVTPAWQRAARLEGVGRGPVATRADLPPT